MPSAADSPRLELADFLRAQRERLTPEAFGFVSGRRRTPGLRREEIAQLSGMSATWYTWIEQGRDVSVSPAALTRLARVLQLSSAERTYLFALAGKADPDAARPKEEADVPAALASALAAIAIPAYVLDRTWNARAWNARAQRLFIGWLDGERLDGRWLEERRLDGAGDKNLLRYVFLADAARSLIADWEDRARRVIAEFRADAGRHLDDPEVRALIEEMSGKSAFFACVWHEHAVLAREGGERTFNHPLDGFLRYEQITMTLSSRPELKLVMLADAGG
ncbi:MAG TPA: helix-turn-helix transcriptional regulator [Alphaproteobacteria bacterium]|nr:helix-turn-helix transcriptional regulator [Alphaproteobacteria bacterium]